MRLADSETVDYLSLEKGTGVVVATLVDDFPGQDEIQRLSLLQRKLNRYFDFIDSGEVYEQLLRTTGRRTPPGSPVRIDIVAKQDLAEEGKRFLHQVEEAAKEAGVGLRFRVITL